MSATKILAEMFEKAINEKIKTIESMSMEELLGLFGEAETQISSAQQKISILTMQQQLIITELRLRNKKE